MASPGSGNAASPFALLVAPEQALKAARRLADLLNLRSVHRMDVKTGKQQDSGLEEFDEAIDLEEDAAGTFNSRPGKRT
jgi:hypothetical protein